MQRIPSTTRIETMTGCDRPTAIKVRRMLDGRDDPAALPGVTKWISQCYNQPRDIELIMAAVDELLDTCGVEAIRCPAEWDRYHGDVVATYCNTGDSYGGTILFDVERGVFYATTWADWVETAERAGRYRF